MPYTVVPDLRETDFGAFEGKTADELSDDPRYRAWVEADCSTPIPEGEAMDSFKARCCAAFQNIVEQLPEDCCAGLVIHGGGIMSIMEAYAQPKRKFYDYHIKNGAYVLCSYEDDRLTIQRGALTDAQ